MLFVQILYQYAPGDAQVNIIVSLSASLLLYFHTGLTKRVWHIASRGQWFGMWHTAVVPLSFTQAVG